MAACLIFETIPAQSLAKEAAPAEISQSVSDNELHITAQSEDEITVCEPERAEEENRIRKVNGSVLGLSAKPQKVKRDYSQSLTIEVTNLSGTPRQYYLESVNENEDVYMNFVEGGSAGAPLTIQAGETQEVKLSVFTQNALYSSYDILINAYLAGANGNVAQSPHVRMSMTFECEKADGEVTIQKGAVNKNTLATDYTICNTGKKKITDVTLGLKGEIAEYARISPNVVNYEMPAGASVTVQLIPDLTKIKADQKEKTEGYLVVSGGANARASAVIDVTGMEITSTSLGELGQIQDNNPFANMEFLDDELSITSNAGDQAQSMTELTKKYYDENDPSKNGVDTKEELADVMGALIGQDGMIDFQVDDVVEFGNHERMKVSVSVSAKLEDERKDPFAPQWAGETGEDGSTCTTRIDEQGNVITTTTYTMSWKDYVANLEKLNGVASNLKIDGADNLLAEGLGIDLEKNEGRRVTVTVVDKLESAALQFPAEFADNAYRYVDYSKITVGEFADKYNRYNSFAQSTAGYMKYANALEMGTNIVSTGVDIYKVGKVWNNPNPNITTQDRWKYTGLQTVKNVNRYLGDKCLSQAGAWIGTAVADGVGAVVGYFAGFVVSGLIDYALDKCIRDMEDQFAYEDGMALYYDIYGHQCTNAGKVTSEFYLPDYTVDGQDGGTGYDRTPDIYETGRMYDGTDGNNYYVDDTRVGYDYYINGNKEPVARSENNGLTQITVVDLSKGKDQLKPGKNVIVRDYDTNPGTHFVTADSEITLIYPMDTQVSFVGRPEGMEQVRRLPDFAVYRENISVAQDPVAGEENTVTLYVYNRGSLGGWADVIVTCEGKELLREENLYMDAFSEKKLEFAWTPEKSGNHTIDVQLVNKALCTKERKEDNNRAARTFITRTRQIPKIGEISPKTAYPDVSGVIYLSAVVTDISDLLEEKTAVYVDGNRQFNSSVVRTEDGNAQISVPVSGLELGEHEVTIQVGFAAGPKAKDLGTIQKQSSFKIVNHSTISFRLDDSFAHPSFYAVSKENGQEYSLSALAGEDGEYHLTKDHHVEEKEAMYDLLIKADNGILLTGLADLEGKTLSLQDGRIIKVETEEGTAVNRIGFSYCAKGDHSSYRSKSFYNTDTIKITGIEDIQLNIEYKRNQTLSGTAKIGPIYELPGMTVIRLADFYRAYSIQVEEETDRSYQTQLYADGMRVNADSSGFDTASCTYTGLITNTVQLEKLDKAQKIEAYLYTYAGSELYHVDLTDYKEPVKTGKKDNHTVRFVSENTEIPLEDVEVSFYRNNDYFYLQGKELSLPDGEYELSVRYSMQGNISFDQKKIQVKGEDVQIVLSDRYAGKTKLTVSWPEIYRTSSAYASFYYTESKNSYSESINSGAPFELPAGTGRLNLNMNYWDEQLYQSETFRFYSDTLMELVKEKDSTVTIGRQFAGRLKLAGSPESLLPGSSFRIRAQDLKDENNMVLAECKLLEEMQGEIIFTNTTDPARKYRTAFTTSQLSDDGIWVTLPEQIKAGHYRYEIHMTTGELGDENVYYGIRTTMEGCGSITPESPQVQNGKDVELTFAPTEGYLLENVIVDGEVCGAVTKYRFEKVVQDHVVKAVFVPDPDYVPSKPAVQPGGKADSSTSVSIGTAKWKTAKALGKKKISLKWKKTKGADGYQIQYSLKKNFAKAKKKTTSKTQIILKGLKSQKTYYVRIRPYKKTRSGKQYGSWSKKKKIRVK
jgi:hypothetical protein